MFKIVIMIVSFLILNDVKEIDNFSSKQTSGDWRIINDVVMGGISKSNFTINEDSTATFKGILSAENNGGFASARSYLEGKESAGYKGVIIRILGDGLTYSLRFRTDKNFDGLAYQAKFVTEKQVWIEHKIPFSSFKPTFRGRTLENKPLLISENISQVGIMITDKQFGPFELKIDWIKFY